MDPQLSTKTVLQIVTITSGPEINNQRFQGWYIHPDDNSLEAIQCPSSQSLFQTTNYAQCCGVGATTCSVFWTKCHGANPVGVNTDTCGSDLFCQTVSIFDQFPVNNALVHSQIICGASAWAASSIYRNVLSTSTSTSLSTITAATSPSTNTAAAPPSQQLASSMPASTQSNIASAPAPSPSLEWIAGAVIGPIVGIASIALLIWLLLRSRRKRQQNNMANGTMPGAHTYAQTDPNTFPHFPHFPHEMYGSNDTQPKVHEMYVRHTDDNLQELPAHECTDRR